MTDGIRDSEGRFSGTVTLDSLLKGTDLRFRKSILGALIQEGFEMDEPLPCLQHPREILEALHGLDTLDFGSAWASFRQVLLAAGRTGILIDMSLCKGTVRRSWTLSPAGGRLGHPPGQLETA